MPQILPRACRIVSGIVGTCAFPAKKILTFGWRGQMVRVSVAQRRKITAGDKMAGHHGNKGGVHGCPG